MAPSAHLKTLSSSQLHAQPPPPPRSKRRKDTTALSAAAAAATSADSAAASVPDVVSSNTAWCCPASKPHPPASSASSSPSHLPRRTPPPLSPLNPTILLSPGTVGDSPPMDASPGSGFPVYPSYYSKFNSALNAGLLNPMSPPPVDKTRSSPTLFDMMANEHEYHPRTGPTTSGGQIPPNGRNGVISAQDRQVLLQERVAEILGSCSPGNQFNDQDTGDVRLTLSSKDGISFSLSVHRHILVAHSRFFASKLSDRWSKQQRSLPHLVEISDCDDVEVYVETLRLMYCKDLRRRLMREDVSKVLGILKVSAAIAFDAGVLSCLEYLEAAPWAEDEEEKVASVLSLLQLDGSGAGEVLKRVSLEVVPSLAEEQNGNGAGGNSEDILLRLLHVVLEGKDEKARREMKGLVSKMLRENNNRRSSPVDLSKESLYSACESCLRLLRLHFLRAASSDLAEATQIARQADNLHWIMDILIERQIADEFLLTWVAEMELAQVHPKVPAIHRYEVSRITARLFVGIGKGQILVSKEARCQLLQTWLEPFYEDFGWMRRACKGLDRHLVEDGLSNTILTLPLAMQQDILLAWFDRFLNSGDDCPNIQRGFEVWWRRAFWRRSGESSRRMQLRISATCENSS